MAEELGEVAEPTPSEVVEITPEEEVLKSSDQSGAIELVKGDVGAQAEANTQVNTVSINSQVETEVVTITDPKTGDVTPFTLTEPEIPTEASEIEEPGAGLDLEVANQATVAAVASATADSGDTTQINEIDSPAVMQTGETVALSNALALVNTTLVDSTIQLGVVNILDAWDGNLILDPMGITGTDTIFLPGSLDLSVDNAGKVSVNATASAQTGTNSQTAQGEANLVTGETMALSSATAVVGLTAVNTEIMSVLAQNLWLWSGFIYNWHYPGSIQTPGEVLGNGNGSGTNCGGECGDLRAEVNNLADVTVSSEATATTGDNTQISSGSATMKTGNTYAGATSTAVVNTTLINSRLSILHLLLFAPWSGNLIMAYPDISTSISAPSTVAEGEEIQFIVTTKNEGEKKAVETLWQHNIVTEGQNVGGDTGEIETLEPGEESIRTVRFATGGYGGKSIVLRASAASANTEVTNTNNVVTATTTVSVAPNNQSEGETVKVENGGDSTETPKLSLSSQNNSGSGVYPGDGVVYEMDANNNGPITAHNVSMRQEFFDGEGYKLSEIEVRVGEIGVTKKKHIRFVLTPDFELPGGVYYTREYLTGESDHGAKTESNRVENPVRLLGRKVAGMLTPVTQAQDYVEVLPGEVLGTMAGPSCDKCTSFPWYLAITLGSTAYYWVCRKREDFGRAARMGLALPLTAYAGLVLSNPSCSNGLVMMPSAGFFCIGFLPISFGIYLSIMKIGKNLNISQ